MENQVKSSDKSPKFGFLSDLLGFIKRESKTTFLPPFGLDGWIFFVAGLVPALIVGWLVYPVVLYSKQPQPLNFSHVVHMDPERVDGIEGETDLEKCLYCHAFRDDGTFAGIPKLETCTECHDDPESPLGEDAEEKKFLTRYVAEESEIPWLSYSRQPDCVYFSHVAHVKMGNLDCRTCHGDHAKTDILRPYEKNRLTGYSRDIWGKNIAGWKFKSWDRMKMDDCAECHTQKGHEQNNACFVCHK